MTDQHEPSAFGDCPECHHTDGFLNDGREQWFICRQHGVKWCAGDNVLSAWRYLSDQEAAVQEAELALFRVVEPHYYPSVIGPEYHPTLRRTPQNSELKRAVRDIIRDLGWKDKPPV